MRNSVPQAVVDAFVADYTAKPVSVNSLAVKYGVNRGSVHYWLTKLIPDLFATGKQRPGRPKGSIRVAPDNSLPRNCPIAHKKQLM